MIVYLFPPNANREGYTKATIVSCSCGHEFTCSETVRDEVVIMHFKQHHPDDIPRYVEMRM